LIVDDAKAAIRRKESSSFTRQVSKWSKASVTSHMPLQDDSLGRLSAGLGEAACKAQLRLRTVRGVQMLWGTR